MSYVGEYRTFPNVKANSTGLATSQYKFVKLASTAGQVVLSGAMNSTTFGGLIVGVLMNAPGGNEEAEVAYSGIVKLKVSTSTLIIGDRIGPNSTSVGAEVAATDNLVYAARALQSSSANNDIITALLIPGGVRY
jgi:hypothetical protein